MSVNRPTLAELQVRFEAAFAGGQIQISDDSHLHAGHAGASSGAGHYRVRIVHPLFDALTRLRRHRLVYDAVADWMPARVHALSIEALSPQESSGTEKG
jgi:BolA family transcriptional regulator, general stress-responsive regulator